MDLNKVLKFVFYMNDKIPGLKRIDIVKAYSDTDQDLYELAFCFIKKDIDIIVKKFEKYINEKALKEQLRFLLTKRGAEFDIYLKNRQKEFNARFYK